MSKLLLLLMAATLLPSLGCEQSSGVEFVFVTDLDGDRDIATLVEGSNYVLLTQNTVADEDPDLTPDGRRIVFASDRFGSFDVFTAKISGSVRSTKLTSLIRLTDDPAADRSPSISPGGDDVLFESNRTGERQIYIIKRDGTGLQQLTTTTGGNWAPAWSVAGGEIAFASARQGRAEIYTMLPDGTDQQRLTTGEADADAPAWSPDGTNIAFVSRRRGNVDLFVLKVADGTVRRLTDDPAVESDPAWLPDGSRVAFGSDRSGDPDLYIVAADASWLPGGFISGSEVGDTDVTWAIAAAEGPAGQ